jgi:hypothetical protein
MESEFSAQLEELVADPLRNEKKRSQTRAAKDVERFCNRVKETEGGMGRDLYVEVIVDGLAPLDTGAKNIEDCFPYSRIEFLLCQSSIALWISHRLFHHDIEVFGLGICRVSHLIIGPAGDRHPIAQKFDQELVFKIRGREVVGDPSHGFLEAAIEEGVDIKSGEGMKEIIDPFSTPFCEEVKISFVDLGKEPFAKK